MDNNQNPKEFHLYSDIRERTGGEIYIGVVGPVRTGKSTFIKRFMDLMVLPNMEDIHERERATDELPQSAAGKTIMTTEPKFVPKEAVEIKVAGEISVKIRLIDCVSFVCAKISARHTFRYSGKRSAPIRLAARRTLDEVVAGRSS